MAHGLQAAHLLGPQEVAFLIEVLERRHLDQTGTQPRQLHKARNIAARKLGNGNPDNLDIIILNRIGTIGGYHYADYMLPAPVQAFVVAESILGTPAWFVQLIRRLPANITDQAMFALVERDEHRTQLQGLLASNPATLSLNVSAPSWFMGRIAEKRSSAGSSAAADDMEIGVFRFQAFQVGIVLHVSCGFMGGVGSIVQRHGDEIDGHSAFGVGVQHRLEARAVQAEPPRIYPVSLPRPVRPSRRPFHTDAGRARLPFPSRRPGWRAAFPPRVDPQCTTCSTRESGCMQQSSTMASQSPTVGAPYRIRSFNCRDILRVASSWAKLKNPNKALRCQK